MLSATFFRARTQEVSKALYKSAKYSEEATPEMTRRISRVRLAQEFTGWTLEYIDNLMDTDPWTIADIWGVLDAQAKLNKPKSKAS